MIDKTKQTAATVLETVPSGLIFFPLSSCPQREVVSATRLAAIPPAFSIRTLPAQATEYVFAFIQIPQDVSAPSERARAQRYVSQLKASKLTLPISTSRVSFSANFLKLTFWQDIKTV